MSFRRAGALFDLFFGERCLGSSGWYGCETPASSHTVGDINLRALSVTAPLCAAAFVLGACSGGDDGSSGAEVVVVGDQKITLPEDGTTVVLEKEGLPENLRISIAAGGEEYEVME